MTANFEDQAGPLRRLLQKLAAFLPMSLVPAWALPRIDRGFYRLSRGRTTFSAWVSGLPVVMLTSTGARTGRPRTVPVLGLPDGDRLVVIASNYGQPDNPGWYHNLRAHPRAVVTWQGSSVQMQARELTGAERQLHVTRGLNTYPWWAKYHQRAAPREIPVIMLEPLRTS
jgi:deazaflavin-dependent oxidoreductase (nitroreductase family)